MEFEPEYYNALAEFFNKKDGITYNIEDLTDTPERFIFHVKHYIDNTVGDMVHVEFNNEYTKVRVIEFFTSRILEFDPNTLPPWVWEIAKKTEPAKVEPAPIKKEQTEHNRIKNLFNQ